MTGSRGPVPVPSSQRRRRNKPEVPTDTAPAAPVEVGSVPVPTADASWHHLARAWFDSLASSGQSRFYEPSDWAMARFGAEMMSRLCSQEKPSAQLLASILGITSSLLATEGDRRRLRLELARGPVIDEDEEAADASVTDLRSRLGG